MGDAPPSDSRGLARDSAHTAIQQAALLGADVVQVAVVVRAVGLDDFGRLALVIASVVLIGQLLDARVGIAITTIAARMKVGTVASAGLVRLMLAVDGVSGLVGFAVVVALAPLVAPGLIGPDGVELTVLYALTLLLTTLDDSSNAVLRLLERFGTLTYVTVGLECLRVVLVVVAATVFEDLTAVVLALVAYSAVSGWLRLGLAAAAFRSGGVRMLARTNPLPTGEGRSTALAMVMHTNVAQYGKIAAAQAPTLVLGAVTGVREVAIFKIGTAGAALVGKLGDPPATAILPRLARLWAAGDGPALRRLLRQVTALFVPLAAAMLVLVIALRHPILEVLGGSEARAAGTVLVIAAANQAVNVAMFWNSRLLFAAGRARQVAALSLGGLGLQCVILYPLIDSHGAEGAAVSVACGAILTNLAATALSIRALSQLR